MEGICEHGNEHLGLRKGETFRNQLNDLAYQST
jgi:hypothetical protein